jgi:hypothetical protein
MYICACGGIEEKYIRMAAERFIRGEVESHNRRFVPTQAEFAAEARKLSGRYRAPEPRLLANPDDPNIPDGPRTIPARTQSLLDEIHRRQRTDPIDMGGDPRVSAAREKIRDIDRRMQRSHSIDFLMAIDHKK